MTTPYDRGPGYGPSRPMRASDQDRHEAVLALSDEFASGRLDQQEFDRRMSAASEAVYLSDLDPLFADLPPRRSSAPAPSGHPVGHPLGHRGPRFPVAPFVLAAFVAAVVLSHGLVLFLMLPLWFLVGGFVHRARYGMYRRYAGGAVGTDRGPWR